MKCEHLLDPEPAVSVSQYSLLEQTINAPELRRLNGSCLLVYEDRLDIGGSTRMNQGFVLLLGREIANVAIMMVRK